MISRTVQNVVNQWLLLKGDDKRHHFSEKNNKKLKKNTIHCHIHKNRIRKVARDDIWRIDFTSSLVKALRSALYSMLTSALPPPEERYVYLEDLAAVAEEDAIAIQLDAMRLRRKSFDALTVENFFVRKPACRRPLALVAWSFVWASRRRWRR